MEKEEILAEIVEEMKADHLKKFKVKAREILRSIHLNNEEIAKLVKANVQLKKDLADLSFEPMEEL